MNSKIYYSNENSDSNFDGDWNAECKYCGRPHKEHIYADHPDPNYKHRMPCKEQKLAMTKGWNRDVRTIKTLVFIGWILIPVVIAVLGFASTVVGAILLVIALFKIAVEGVILYGSPDNWIPGHREKAEKRRKMEHYFHHCERTPEGFERLKFENFDREEENEQS